jgi:bifunctional non-homologous end joining protein LigD
MGTRNELKIDGRNIPVSNLEKVLYPAAHFTKAQLIDYYVRVSPFLLPHLKDRPITLKRYPDGVRGEFFYEKDAPGYTPKWVKTFPVPRRTGGSDIHYVLINDLSTLVWAANIASLELHPFLHRVPNLRQPTYVVFDLDPGKGVDVLACVDVAYLLKDVLERLQLDCFPKVSGPKGLQLYVPLNTPIEYAVTQPFARTVAELLAKQHPDQIVSEMAKAERIGKVFIDWSQNADFKTTIGVYSLRAKPSKPFVSLPMTWEELSTSRKRGKPDRLYFEPESALKRLEQVGDLFAPVLSLKQSLPAVITSSIHTKRARSAAESKTLRTYAKKRDFPRQANRVPAFRLRADREHGGDSSFKSMRRAICTMIFAWRCTRY